jgi:hypothetical protein
MDKIRLLVDSRDTVFSQRFGTIGRIPLEFFADDASIPEDVQEPGNVQCTAYGIVYCAENLKKKQYDINQLFGRYPSDGTGANPRVALGEAVRGGILPIGANATEKVFSSYWQAHNGDKDAFDNVRSAMTLSGMPCLAWSHWYHDWSMYSNAIMPMGKNRSGGHFWVIKGWKEVAGEVMFIVEWWGGYTMYMSRNVFNEEISKLGCGSAILSTIEIDQKRIKTLQEKIIDILKNLVLLYQELILKI